MFVYLCFDHDIASESFKATFSGIIEELEMGAVERHVREEAGLSRDPETPLPDLHGTMNVITPVIRL
jgi:hypothetical protein